MQLEIKSMGSLCALKTFTIKGMDGEYSDFGTKRDESPETAEDYGCGDMKFTSKPATEKVLSKYNISLEEYQTICEKLDEALSFGECGWCV